MTTDRNSYSSITKAIGLFGGVKLFQILVSLIKNKLVAILLGPTGMGINGMIMSTTALISSLTNFGLQVSAVRDVSKAYTSNDEDTINQTVSVLRRLVLFTGLLGTILTFVFASWLSQWAFGDESYTNAFRLVSVVLFLDQVCIGQTVLLQGTFNYKYMAKASFWGSILGLIISIPIYYIWHFDGIVPVIILTSLANLLLSTYYSRKIPYKKQQLSVKETFKKGRVMLLLGLALTSTGIMDNGKIYLLRLVIAHFGDLADVGLYTAGVAVANQYIGMVLMSMASDYSPRLAAVSDDNVTFIDAINKQMKLLVTLVTPLIIFFILFIKPITILLYSTKFIPITGMLEWMMLGMTFRSVAWCITFCYVAKGDAKFFFWNEVVSTSYSALFAVLGYILDGFEGMGVGFCLMYVLYAIQHLIISYRKYGYQVSRDVLKAIVPQVIMTCIFFLILRCLGYSLARYVVGICGMIVISIFSLKYLNQMLNIKHLFSKFIKRKNND